MTTRKPIVGGNWKMHCTAKTAGELVLSVAELLMAPAGDDEPAATRVDVVLFPPFPYLMAAREILQDRAAPIGLGGQDLWREPEGAFTGEVSGGMLRDCGASAVLCGHSERRHVLNEPDELVNAKLRAALAVDGLAPVLCVGETLEQREAGETDAVNDRQLRAGLKGVAEPDARRVVIAYEPVWAIGTGRTASPDDAQAAHAQIRRVLAELYSPEVAGGLRVQYGGSVKAENAADLFAQPDIDGGLVGGASLDAEAFAAIVRAAAASAD